MSLIVMGAAWDTMPGMTLPVTTERFSLRQRITLMVNRYEIRTMDESGAEGALVAVAQQKRMAFKEHVTFYADETRTEPVFSFKARQHLDLAATYDVFDADGQPIGWFRKDFGRSLLRSSWHLGTAGSSEINRVRQMGERPAAKRPRGPPAKRPRGPPAKGRGPES